MRKKVLKGTEKQNNFQVQSVLENNSVFQSYWELLIYAYKQNEKPSFTY